MKKMKLVFATGNVNKLKEVAQLVSGDYDLIGLEQVGITEEIPEPYNTLEANALHKARYVFQKSGNPSFADDTGLEIECLQGAPGVLSARFAGPGRRASDNIAKVLELMKMEGNRAAQFRTVIAWVDDREEHLFEGIVRGIITENPVGENGFGYDPIFIPEGESRTFAELTMEQKGALSHRAIAFKKLIDFLKARE